MKPVPILLEGETGVGKTLIAKKIHQLLCRFQRDEPISFQQISTVNLGAQIVESELFGVMRGAWTGSVTRIGKVLLGWGGVIFLDEIGDLTPEMQSKFLVYLDTFEFAPDGWPYDWKVHSPAFIVAATNKNLKEAVEKGLFREDLYYRFAHKLTVPPLRERRYDIRALIDFALQNSAINRLLNPDKGESEEPKRWIDEITLSALSRLEEYQFPGNFRELEAILSGPFSEHDRMAAISFWKKI
ncbi:MAG: sigma-54-dependent Fis family transcriptional regulator [Chloracidobacterium sp.]|nr:sigma-54-dependent Fis family transcriptional regulator [Chloracidobacterium sp.]